ncbi:MAG: TolC family protein [Kofleriaceae bacterium]
MRLVLDHSPRRPVHAARHRAADMAISAAAPLPNLTLSYEREAVPSLDAADDFVRLGWTLDLAGRRGLATEAARAGADAEHALANRDEFLLDNDARTVYAEAAFCRARVAQLERSRARLSMIVDALRSRARQGDASDYDVDRAALELELLDDERAEAQRKLDAARLRLGALAGEPTAAYDTSAELVVPAKPVLQDRVRAGADELAARARARQAEREAVAAGRGWVPRFELVAGMIASTSASGDGVGYVVGIQGDLPVFDRGGAHSARSRAEAARWRHEAEAAALETRAETEQARRDLAARIDQAIAFAAGPAKRASDLERRATVTYREGDRPILELLDVHRTARHAALRGLELIYEARRAELVLQRSLGAP